MHPPNPAVSLLNKPNRETATQPLVIGSIQPSQCHMFNCTEPWVLGFAVMQALDLAALRLREKLSAAQATVATAMTAPKPPGAPSADAFGAASGATASGKQRLHSTGVMASAAPTSTDSPRRHWIP